MKPGDILRSWGRILSGYHPALSIEITKECPLACPGCYAFQPGHLAGAPLTSVADFKGDRLVERVLTLVEEKRPLVVYIVGGEPLVRFRELSELLPRLSEKRIEVRVVTSAVRPIPQEWASIANLGIVVSIDGLQPEHDERRTPATYERILKHVEGRRIVVHYTVTSQMMARDGYIEEYVDFWSRKPEVTGIEVSFFTPQVGETSAEILTEAMRRKAVATLAALKPLHPKLVFNHHIEKAYLEPPESPDECIFASVTQCLSPDLETVVEPCQFGGNPKCTECGCLGSIGLHAIGRYRLPIGVKIATLFKGSRAIGSVARRLRDAGDRRDKSISRPSQLEV